MTQVRVRFAPSPTGYLHVGNARMAIINWLFAQKHKGHFLLRFDDTDLERSTEAFSLQISKDLHWLGITPDDTVKQSDRLDRYQAAVGKLKSMGRLYPCYELPEELEFKRKLQISRGKPPVYDRAALSLTAEEIARLEAEGRAPHWRFLLEDKTISWQDASRGAITFQGGHLSDPVLIRTDGQPIYTLASVVDDIELGITHIIRGEDHLTNTAVQIQLFEALEGDISKITFGHLSLIIDASGEGFSKRDGSLSLKTLQEEGIDPMALISLMAHLGTRDDIAAYADQAPLIENIDLEHFSKSSPKFDINELHRLNQSLLHMMSYEVARPRLKAKGLPLLSETIWNIIRGNIQNLSEAALWDSVIQGKITIPSTESPELIQTALDLLPKAPWDDTTWGQWTKQLQEKTGCKGKGLYLPLRLALTGHPHGPEMRLFFPIIGAEETQRRLTLSLQNSDQKASS